MTHLYMHIHTGSVASKEEWLDDIRTSLPEKMWATEEWSWDELSTTDQEAKVRNEFSVNFKLI